MKSTHLAPCGTLTLIQPEEAHSFLSFSSCIELCLLGRPGGRRSQRLLHLSPLFVNYPPSLKTTQPLCSHRDFGPRFLIPLLAHYICISATLLCHVVSSIVPTASATIVTVHKGLLCQSRPRLALSLLTLHPRQKSFSLENTSGTSQGLNFED